MLVLLIIISRSVISYCFLYYSKIVYNTLTKDTCLSKSGQDVGVTSIENSQSTDSEKLTDNGTQFIVTTLEVVNLSLGQHGVVFQLRLSQDWGVTSNDDQLGLTGSQGLNNGLVAQGVLTGLDNQTQLGVDVIGRLVLWGL